MYLRKFTEEQTDIIIKLYNSNISLREIGRRYKISLTTLRRIMKENNVEIRKRYEDLTDQEIGSWKIIERDFSKEGRETRWFCLCKNCNKIKSVIAATLIKHESHQCIDCFRDSIFTGHINFPGSLFRRIRGNANTRGKSFELSPKFLEELYETQSGLCALSGVKIYFPPRGQKFDCKNGNSSLDRINSLLGYEPDNVRWIEKNINQMKWHLDDQTFLIWVAKIANYNNIDSEIKIIEPEIVDKQWKSIVSGAKRRNILLNITKKEIEIKFLKQNGKCNLTGEPIGLMLNKNHKNYTASLDRINSQKGYTNENIQWIHRIVNFMKVDISQDIFIETCKNINTYQKQKLLPQNT